MAMVVVDHFEIPGELALRLSDLLTKQSIRERLLQNVIDDPVKFEQAENMLMPIAAEINKIKRIITTEHVPAQYNSERYSWNYDGYEISGQKVQILENR